MNEKILKDYNNNNTKNRMVVTPVYVQTTLFDILQGL